MAIYIITLFLLLLFSFFELRCELTKSQKNIMSFILFFVFVFQAGLRWKTGTDWQVYLDNFENTIDYSSVIINILAGFEIGYGSFVFLIKNITDSYSVFLVIHAIVYYFLIFYATKKLSPFPFVTLLVFYVSTLGVLGSNRQLLAVAICLFSIQYVLDKKPYKFFFLIAIAFLFHSTAILFCIMYFLNRPVKVNMVIFIIFISFIIGKTSIPIHVFSILGSSVGGAGESKVSAYTELAGEVMSDHALSLVGLIRRLLYLTLFLYTSKILQKKIIYYNLIFNGYLFGLAFYFLFSSSLIIMVNRGSLYFNVLECLLISCQFIILKDRLERCYVLLLLFVFCIFLFYQSISAYEDLFIPYKGILINQDFDREMY
ncbi:EpsG family protein [Flavobacterium olei]|uniref:EpsG family protein n=1 Tax=Flavobacterium olei TaxID=1886782 RepID=UPI003219A918